MGLLSSGIIVYALLAARTFVMDISLVTKYDFPGTKTALEIKAKTEIVIEKFNVAL